MGQNNTTFKILHIKTIKEHITQISCLIALMVEATNVQVPFPYNFGCKANFGQPTDQNFNVFGFGGFLFRPCRTI